MKKIIPAVLVIILCGTNGFSQQRQIKDLVGRWEIIEKDDSGACLEVIDSVTLFLSYNGERKKIHNYKFDFQKSPIWFDFSTGDSSSLVSIKSLLEIVGDSMIKWQLFLEDDRTEYFSSTRGELFYLRKSKTTTTPAIVSN